MFFIEEIREETGECIAPTRDLAENDLQSMHGVRKIGETFHSTSTKNRGRCVSESPER